MTEIEFLKKKSRLSLAFGNVDPALANMYLSKKDYDKSILEINLVDLWYPTAQYIESLKRRNNK